MRDTLKYTFFLSLFSWILLSIYIGYQYVGLSSTQANTKGGTFVEGIFGNTSYLPYLRNDIQSNFYQGLIFNPCLRITYDKGAPQYIPDLCTVTTQDNQNYIVRLNKGFIRSDGTPVSLEDIYFTYNEILRSNKRDIGSLDQYAKLTISKDVNATLKINFPVASPDNILFFTNYILPNHILANSEISDYKEMFALKPVYTNCANLVSQSNDAYSLVFNIVNCNQSNLNFYQVKNAISFEALKSSLINGSESIIDTYVGDETLPGYVAKKILTNQLVILFFNTNSEKLRVRGRRALGGLIKHNLYASGYGNYFKKNDDGLFDVFQSTGSTVKDLLNREYSENTLTKSDLLDINVKILPKSISIKGENQKSVYFIESGVSLATEFTFDKGYDKITIEYKGQTYAPKHFVKGGRSGRFTFGLTEKTFGDGINKYSVYGYDKNKKILVESLDIYNVIPQTISNEPVTSAPVKFTVVYYNNSINNFIGTRLQDIFQNADISENFVFEKINSTQELQGRLMVGDYDILINAVNMGFKQDITKLFNTDKSEINPSQYQNQKLTTLLTRYMSDNESNKKKALAEINSIYSKDIPFVILGTEYLNLNMKPNIAEKVFTGRTDTLIDENNRRQYIYTSLKLVTNIHIDGKKIRNFNNFSNFIINMIK